MAKRYSTKKQVTQKWNTKISTIKEVYDANKLKSDPGFYNSRAYKDLKKRRSRALYRYDHREEINAKRREREEVKKRFIGPLKGDFDKVSDTSVYEAYNGAGRIYEDSLIQKHKDGLNFKGSVEYKKEIRYFSNYADFRIDTNRIISIIYALVITKGSDELLVWRVTRSYSIRHNAVLINYKFYRVDGKEDETES